MTRGVAARVVARVATNARKPSWRAGRLKKYGIWLGSLRPPPGQGTGPDRGLPPGDGRCAGPCFLDPGHV